MRRLAPCLVLLLAPHIISAGCPFHNLVREDPHDYPKPAEVSQAQAEAMANVNYKEVMEDLKVLMTDSKEFWPADYGHYGPLFVRLAWHNAGSYRSSDGRGGVDGARQRFEPERSWADNTNLDKARALLWPIKEKYGQGLSWGDLIVLSGNAAIESMGGPVFGFCGGRIDAADGSESVKLGPTLEQEILMPCEVNGECEEPLGADTIGLIYVNPEGHMGNADPAESANDIRDVFGRMNMNDYETVALIGGGHAFGKTHGACPDGPGPSPEEDPANSWPGLCGTGKGEDTYTSGFELPFTSRPTYWDNEYFQNLVNYKWQVHTGPGNHKQWEPVVADGMPPHAISADGTHNQTIGLLTSDVALMWEDEAYKSLVMEFAENMEAFDRAFELAWYKLTTRDMGPISRCNNEDTPPPQPFQYPLPDPPAGWPDFQDIKTEIGELLDNADETIGMFTRLAWQCISTFRSTDYLGGCNGARIRFSPQKDWSVNINVETALDFLQPIKLNHGTNLSWADLIVLAGNTALEKAGGKHLTFCGGRTDATDGMGSEFLAPKITGNFSETLVQFKDDISITGLTQTEFTALIGAGYAVGESSDCDGLYCNRDSFQGTAPVSSSLSNIFFKNLLSESWEEYTIPSTGKQMYKAVGKDLLIFGTDLMFRLDPELLAISQDFAADNDLFLHEVAAAWTKLANADRFDGPTGNLCDQGLLGL
eukprot:TRINITY_DN11107_c0_g1_i1.p1 TRINITY_DN11107_c0_g1~~TRINITY_DN11107_c0_g1_i1.p1  ORF type:complete len:707 (-),score=154.91 TRINITY_DN11107_c0_g1_i1:62-2182(-)